MSQLEPAVPRPAGPGPVADPGPPAWLREALGGRPSRLHPAAHGLPASDVTDAPRARLVRVAIPAARAMDILTFQQAVADAYRAAFEQLKNGPAPHPVRLWAFVPGIHGEMGPGLDRYMAFNAGRYAAYSAHYGGREAFPVSVPTASAVGTRGDAFVLYCLSADEPGRPIENPRQIPAYRYSRRWGPLPPCFARATLVGPSVYGVRVALLGGTASIRGEDSVHVGDLGRQIEETLGNLAALVHAAAGQEDAAALAGIREMRVYHPRAEDEPGIRSAVEAACPGLRHLEMLPAELCRRELLVEIEGVAEV